MNIAENAWPVAIVLATVALLLFLSWNVRRRKLLLVLAAVSAVLAGGTVAVDQYVETDREKVSRQVVELVRAFQRKDLERTLSYFSPSDTTDRALVTQVMKLVQVHDDLRISDVSVVVRAQEAIAVSRFRANATVEMKGFGNVGWQASRWELTWKKENGEWKVTQVDRLHPLEEKKLEFYPGAEE